MESSAPPTSSRTPTNVQYAVPGIAIPVTDSPVESAPNTIEHIESSCEPVYSLDASSSEDIELLEAQAMAAKAMLRLAEAKNKKKKSSSASARSGRSSNPQRDAQPSNSATLPRDIIANRMIPGHALHEKGLQRQIGVGTLVNNQQRRALAVPVINR